MAGTCNNVGSDVGESLYAVCLVFECACARLRARERARVVCSSGLLDCSSSPAASHDSGLFCEEDTQL